MKTIEKYCNLTIEYVICVVFGLLVPLLYSPMTADHYSLLRMSGFQIGIAIILVAFITKVAATREFKFELISFDIRVLLLLVSMISSLAFSLSPELSLFGYDNIRSDGFFFRLNYFIMYFLAVSLFTDRGKISRFINFSAVAALAVSIIGIMQYLHVFSKHNIPRIFSTIGHWNFVGAYLGLLMPIIITQFFSQSKRALKLFYLITFAFMSIALYLTFSRSCWLGLIFGAAIFCFFLGKELWEHSRRDLMNLAIVSLLIFASISYINHIQTGGTNLEEHLTKVVDFKDGSGVGRFYIWKATLQMIGEYPLTGGGLNTYRTRFAGYRPDILENIEGKDDVADHAHNDFLDVAANEGIIGLFIYLFLVFGYIKLFAGTILFRGKAMSWDDRILLSGVFWGLIANLVQLQFNFSVFIVNQFFWLILAMGVAIVRKYDIGILKVVEISKFHKLIVPICTLVLLASVGVSTFMLSKQLSADYYYNRGLEAYVKNDPGYVKFFFRAIDLNPHLKVYYQPISDYYDACALLNPKRKNDYLADKLKLYKRLAEFTPWDKKSLYAVAAVYKEVGDKRNYFSTLKMILEVDPEFKYAPYDVRQKIKRGMSKK